MPIPAPQNIKVYEKSATSTSITEIILNAENLTHTTRIPGGFWTLSFSIPMTEQRYWDWNLNRRLFRVVLEGVVKQTLWEGRLEDMSGPLNSPLLTFRGYWGNFEDSVSNNKTYSKTYNSGAGITTIDAALKDMLDNGFHVDTEQVETTDQSQIAAPGTTIDASYPADWSLWRAITDAQSGLLSYGDSSNNILDFAVWEDRVVFLTSRSPTSVTWKSFIGSQGGVKDIPLRSTWRRLYNAVHVLSSTAGAGAVATDSASIVKYIRREQTIPDNSNITGTTGAADAKGTAELARKKDIQQELDTLVLDRVWDENGIEQPLCKVRAGEVIQIPDLIPTSVGLGSVSLDALRTFVIEEATCDHSRGELVIRPDRSSTSLAALLSRAQIPT